MQQESRAADPRTEWLFRLAALFGAISLPLLWLLSPDDAYDPLWQRVVVGIWILMPTVLGMILPYFRRNHQYTMYIGIFLPNLWFLFLVFKNDFALIYTVSYSLVFILCSILFRHFWWMLGFLGILFATSLSFYPLLESPLIEPAYFYLGQGSSMLLVGIITERLLHERRLLVSRSERFQSISRAAFDASSEGVLVTDLEGYALEFNQQYLDIWGLDADTMDSGRIRPGVEVILAQLENPELFNQAYHTAKENPDQYIQQELLTLDGRVIQRTSRPLRVRDERAGRIWFFRDVTAERQEKIGLEEKQERLARQNEILVRLASAAQFEDSSLESVLEEILSEGLDPLKVERVTVWRTDDRDRELQCIYAHGWPPNTAFTRKLVLSNHPNYHRTLRRVRQLTIMDAETDPLLNSQRIIFPTIAQTARIDIPFREQGHLNGIIIFHDLNIKREWTDEDQAYAASLGDLIQFALESNLRRAAELAVKESNAILQSVFEKSGIGIVVTSHQGHLLDFNQTFADLWNVPSSLLRRGQEVQIVEHIIYQVKGQKFDPEEAMKVLLEPQEERYVTLHLYDGRIIERYVGKMEMDGITKGHTWYFREVTGQVKAQLALRESEQRNRAILDAVPDLMLRINSRGELIDKKVPEDPIYEVVRHEVIDSLIELFPEEFEKEIRRMAARVLVDGEVSTMEAQLGFLGQDRDLEIRLVRSGEQEVLAIVRDVTQRKTTERELIQRNFELDSFVYRASHDLKAPLNSLMGLLDIIRMEEVTESVGQYLDLMDRSVVKLDTFIRNLTDFSRITRLEIQYQEVDLAQLHAEIIESLRYMDGSERVEQLLEINHREAFVGDQFHLSIVMTNLISNAIKYQDHTKAQPFVKCSVDVHQDTVHISIHDNGIGIPQKYQDRLFELFFRASNQSFGSGLGLYITKNAVEKMDGVIDMESKEKEGTTFRITLPNHPVPVIAAEGGE